eukprot:6256110-Alexandrium_andersonii.AAC.1
MGTHPVRALAKRGATQEAESLFVAGCHGPEGRREGASTLIPPARPPPWAPAAGAARQLRQPAQGSFSDFIQSGGRSRGTGAASAAIINNRCCDGASKRRP